jgi:hypothetical protein
MRPCFSWCHRRTRHDSVQSLQTPDDIQHGMQYSFTYWYGAGGLVGGVCGYEFPSRPNEMGAPFRLMERSLGGSVDDL